MSAPSQQSSDTATDVAKVEIARSYTINLQYLQSGDRESIAASEYNVGNGFLSYKRAGQPKTTHFLTLDVLRSLEIIETTEEN